MKKYISFIILSILLGIIFIPNVYAENKVEIKSIELVEKSDNTTINSKPKYSNLEMNFDLSFKAKDDYAKYKVIVKNGTNKDYKLSKNTSFNESEYITYKYEVEENDLKAKSENTIYVTITYSKKVESTKLSSGKYIESNKAVVQFLNDKGEVINPNTGTITYIILILFIIVSLLTLILLIKFKNKNKIIPLVLILILTLIPTMTYAVETLTLTIDINVEIEESYSVNYITYETVNKSEESNYKLFNYKDYGIDSPTCYSIYENDDYEVCSIIYDSKMYATGDTVDVLNKITYHALNDEDELVENKVKINDRWQYNIWYYWLDTDDLTLHTQNNEYYFYWDYYKIINNYDDIDEMNFTGNFYDKWSDTSFLAIYLYSSNSFTMPHHSVFFNIELEQPGFK